MEKQKIKIKDSKPLSNRQKRLMDKLDRWGSNIEAFFMDNGLNIGNQSFSAAVDNLQKGNLSQAQYEKIKEYGKIYDDIYNSLYDESGTLIPESKEISKLADEFTLEDTQNLIQNFKEGVRISEYTDEFKPFAQKAYDLYYGKDRVTEPEELLKRLQENNELIPESKEISKLADVELEENDENDNIEEIKTFLSENYTYNSGGTADWSVENWRIGDLFYNTDKNYGIFVVLDDNNTFAIVRRDGNEDGYDDTQLKTDIFTIEILILAIKNSIKSEENDGKIKEMIIDKEELPREEILNSVQINKIRDILQAFVKETTDTILAGALSPHIKKLVVTEVNEVQEIINKLQNVETLK